MPSPIDNYRKMVEEPWGRMFYDQIFQQLVLPETPKKKILDFGAGFGITSAYYGKCHDVTAVEPSEEMRNLRVSGSYTLIPQGLDYLSTIAENTYDIVLCHNVIEYVDNRNEILSRLVRVLKPGGILSIIKHNLLGRVMTMAVLPDDPKAALDLLNETPETSMFGSRSVYSQADLESAFGDVMSLSKCYGIRAFFGLSSNNEVKYTDDWYKPMLELETRASTMEEFRKVAFFNHLIYTKREA